MCPSPRREGAIPARVTPGDSGGEAGRCSRPEALGDPGPVSLSRWRLWAVLRRPGRPSRPLTARRRRFSKALRDPTGSPRGPGPPPQRPTPTAPGSSSVPTVPTRLLPAGLRERGARSDPPRCLLRCSLEKSWSLVLPGASVGRLSSPCWTVKGPEDGSADFPSPFLPAVSLAPSSRSPE